MPKTDPEQERYDPHKRANLSADDVVAEYPIAKATLAKWRCYGTGPAWCKLGARVVYRRVDLDAWVESNARKPLAAND